MNPESFTKPGVCVGACIPLQLLATQRSIFACPSFKARYVIKVFLQELVKQAPENTAVLAVETSCIVPVTLSKKAYAKAYNFRSVTGNQRKERLKDLPYPNQLNIGVAESCLLPNAAYTALSGISQSICLINWVVWSCSHGISLDALPLRRFHRLSLLHLLESLLELSTIDFRISNA